MENDDEYFAPYNAPLGSYEVPCECCCCNGACPDWEEEDEDDKPA